MNELRRMAYLEAMGVDSYVSRSQLCGAAATRRLVIVAPRPAEPPAMPEICPESDAAALPRQAGAMIPRLESAPPAAVKPVVAPVSQAAAAVPGFSLAAIVAGGWLWLEELEGMPLAREQVQLVQAMAQAVGRVAGAGPDGAPQVTLFDWPFHNNQQLDQSEEAALAGVAGFIRRKLEQHQCRGLVLLGRQCETRVPQAQLDGARVGVTLNTAAMLVDPSLKKQAWHDLQPLAARL